MGWMDQADWMFSFDSYYMDWVACGPLPFGSLTVTPHRPNKDVRLHARRSVPISV